MMDVIASRVACRSVELEKFVRPSTKKWFVSPHLMVIVKECIVIELNCLVLEVWDESTKSKI
jgi:hypothetical protein